MPPERSPAPMKPSQVARDEIEGRLRALDDEVLVRLCAEIVAAQNRNDFSVRVGFTRDDEYRVRKAGSWIERQYAYQYRVIIDKEAPPHEYCSIEFEW